jgi:predicted transcriptional regulator
MLIDCKILNAIGLTMERLNLSVSEVAKACNIGQPSVSKWLNGTTKTIRDEQWRLLYPLIWDDLLKEITPRTRTAKKVCTHCTFPIESDDHLVDDRGIFCCEGCSEKFKGPKVKKKDLCANCGGGFGKTYRRSASKNFCSVGCSEKDLEKTIGSETEEVKPSDLQVSGAHYKGMAIQPAEYNTKNKLGFLEGNVVKYVSRHGSKNGVDDLRKAIHCLELLIEYTYDGE